MDRNLVCLCLLKCLVSSVCAGCLLSQKIVDFNPRTTVRYFDNQDAPSDGALGAEAEFEVEVPYFVVWNSETQRCRQKYGIDVNVTKYGIHENSHDGWVGEEVSLLYRPGLWPWIADNGTVINGGVPQAGNLSAHLQQAQQDILRQVPDGNFSGFGVLDFEKWRPIWETNWDSMKRYQNYSIQLVRNVHPDWSEAKIESEAKKEFENAARGYMEQTLLLARRLRPSGKWGYYTYPFCFLEQQGYNCSAVTFTWNNRMLWLANASTALYPSVYYFEATPEAQGWPIVYGKIKATEQWRAAVGDVHKPIIPYSKYSLSNTPIPFYTKMDLINSIGLSSDLGVNGVILWGDHFNEQSSDSCEDVKQYLDTQLGPYTQKILNFTKICSSERCHGNGRCVANVSTPLGTSRSFRETDELVFLPRNGLNMTYNYETLFSRGSSDLYRCSCYPGWSGPACETKLRA